ncbi:MAG: twin-arginine translocase TatA/TatE family subunit [Chloroflexi bacterium]|nr:twin-arginine translocase TatA/TatE family subunit [Chloroflexota bacterium]
MNFLNVGPWELMVILMIAILLIGPKRMAEVVQWVGRASRQMRELSGEFVRAMRSEIQATEEGVRQVVDEAMQGQPGTGGNLKGELEATRKETDQTLEGLIHGELGLSSIKADLEATSRETRDLMRSVLSDMATVTSGGDVTSDAEGSPVAESTQSVDGADITESSTASTETSTANPDEPTNQPTSSEAGRS